jgi:dipeptidase E
MKKLFLASLFMDVAGLFAKHEKGLAGKKVAFIPTASRVEKAVFYVRAGKKALEKLGLVVDELDISTASADEIHAKLAASDMIYVAGGNTFFLLQELKRTGADRQIAEAVHAGKLYIGESAGAVVASPNIEYAQAMDSIKKAPDLAGYDALGLVDFYTVPHASNFPFKKAAQKMLDAYSPQLEMKAISNKDAIWVVDEAITIERG